MEQAGRQDKSGISIEEVDLRQLLRSTRKLSILLMTLVIGTSAILVYWLWLNRIQPHRPMAFEEITVGMTYQQVEAILGPPVGKDDFPHSIPRLYGSEDGRLMTLAHTSLFWYDGNRLMQVYFDEDMRVIGRSVFSKP